jgi:UDP-N-acetylmuramate: L-alanyl-gamma-D-glutamyl-meso-diaminopimelate ligase
MKKIHFIGIGGTAMASLAVAFKRAGFLVTGSDLDKIFSPMSEYLEKNKIKYNINFKAENIKNPDDIVIGNAFVDNKNPEIITAKKKGLPIIHFPRLIEKYLIKKNSVVVAGTYGKTTITAMTAWILEKCKKNPNYMLGGIPIDLENGARLENNQMSPKGAGNDFWSVVEGDEYPSAMPWDNSPKFKYYHPKFLILTSAEWDHMDVYKTKESYIEVFKKLVASVPKDGLIVAKFGGENLEEVLKNAKCRIVWYSNSKISKNKNISAKGGSASGGKALKQNNIYYIDKIKVISDKTFFSIFKGRGKIDSFETKLLGEFNLENLCAGIALANELKMPIKKIQSAVKSFSGVKRRLEIRGVKNGITIIDDFAHNPSKAKQSVLALRRHFPKSKIYIIFEPNRGGQSEKCLRGYDFVFSGANKIFIPKLSKYTPRVGVKDVSGKELAEYLKKTHSGVVYQPIAEKLVAWLKQNAKKGDVVAFLGSRNFGGVLEKVLNKKAII